MERNISYVSDMANMHLFWKRILQMVSIQDTEIKMILQKEKFLYNIRKI